MNFLAHLLLSGDNERVILGNYAGDFIKGRLTVERTVNWDQDYLLGLRLHRYIDSFTDAHPAVREAKKMVSRLFGKLSGIIIDIYFDYFLAKHFFEISGQDLTFYAQQMYGVIERNENFLPAEMKPMLRSMIRQDWLAGYATFEGIDLTFQRMSGRASYLEPIRYAGLELRENELFYEKCFLQFYPQLSLAADNFIRTGHS
ncbi:Acyl carrier protein phosphodiesterase [Dyadobacter sp. CECT 9275]|uniref:Acyl carrier protein phosphodiesterase n=1 Tax=Dyadobacter helix TaxID=2822344 RepID=A0A916NBF1_9BACT|nr:ACP phosphodiesterase [Dyadobacter sp. CECT 9275]CAG4997710.1 Acyl carrier protein phosphodiesterase [Dyadobacter sp. CECT 9275]